jgi:hypothetical protein
MPQAPRHLFAQVRQACEYRPSVTAIVLFGLAVEGEDEPPVYMEIRFIDYAALQIEGDHMMLSFDEAIAAALRDSAAGLAADEPGRDRPYPLVAAEPVIRRLQAVIKAVSPAQIHRLALLQKRRHAFFLVVRTKQ